MIKPTQQAIQTDLFSPNLVDIIDLKHPLVILSKRIDWERFDKEFNKLYSHTGRPGLSIRLMVSILLLKQMYNESDESVIARWFENPYWQYFSGMGTFQHKAPMDPSELVHFRKRIGAKGVESIFAHSVELHGAEGKEDTVIIDSTVQQKNITYPTDFKLHMKIIEYCKEIAKEENIKLRQSYTFTVKNLKVVLRFQQNSKNFKKTKQAARKLKTIAGRLVREIKRKLPSELMPKYEKRIEIFERILEQTKDSKDKIYSIHEPQVYCMAKGKENKKYEFGNKVTLAIGKVFGVVMAVISHKKNIYDGKALPEVFAQIENRCGKILKLGIGDRGYRGSSKIGDIQMIIPKPSAKNATRYQRSKIKAYFRRRASI